MVVTGSEHNLTTGLVIVEDPILMVTTGTTLSDPGSDMITRPKGHLTGPYRSSMTRTKSPSRIGIALDSTYIRPKTVAYIA